jgi:formylglycine-generating enzyme required for sulfatase activity
MEFAGTALGTAPFVWGADLPQCGDAVFGRTSWVGDYAPCRSRSEYGGPLPVGTTLRDHLVLPTGTIDDLVGNLHEWTSDMWNRADEPCWPSGVLHDPHCQTPSPADGDGQHTLKGGSWYEDASGIAPGLRAPDFDVYRASNAGFRCAGPSVP